MRRQALITGGAGFLGRHFAAQLERDNWDVITVDVRNLSDPIDLFSGGPTRLHQVMDVRKFLDQSYDTGESWDLVIHCAARNPHRQAIDTEPLNLAYNIGLDAAVFNWAARMMPRQLVYISSSAIYPLMMQKSKSALRLREDFVTPVASAGVPQQPDGPYGWTKYVGELMADGYRQVGGNVIVVRPFSGYGEDQSLDFPFNALVNKVMIGLNPVPVWGDPTQTRDWIYVDDLVNATLTLVNNSYDGPPINLCTGHGTSMEELVRIIATVADIPDSVGVISESDRPMGVHTRVGHPGQILNHYTPQVSLYEGVSRAVSAWREKHRG